MLKKKHLLLTKTLTGRGRGGSVVYLLNDQFTTPDPAPITDPRTAEPSPGKWDVTQTGDTIAVTSSGLEITGADAFRGVVSQETFAIGSGGVGLFSRQSANGNRNYSGFGNSLSNGAGGGIQLDTTYVYRITGPGVSISSILTGLTEGTIYDIWVIRDDAGHVCWVFDGKLIWASAGVNTDTLKINHANYHASSTGKHSATKVIDLPTSGYTGWSTQYGIATSHVASPSSGETITQVADALVDITWTPALGETLDLMVRRTDDSTCWSVVCAEATAASNPDTIKLIERNGGDTERSSAAQVFTAGTPYRVRVVMDGTGYVTWVDTTKKNTYTDAGSFNTTATGVKASGFTTGADLVACPRDVSGLLPSL